ncbi:hypothetical protein D3C80_1852110 [compost metagenome]
MKSRLESDVAMAGSDQTIDVAVSTETPQPGFAGETLEAFSFAVHEHVRRSRIKTGAGEVFAAAGVGRLASKECLSRPALPAFAGGWNIDQTTEWLFLKCQ